MKQRIAFALAVALMAVLSTTELYPITGDEALAKFRGRMLGIGKLSGVISWSTGSGQSLAGTFKYMAPDKIYVKFSNPSGKILVSNGRKLWVYSPSSSICGVQDLAAGSSSGGIAGMTADYRAIVTSQSSDGYTIKLKNSDKAYPEIILRVDSSFFLKRAIFKDKDGDGFSFTLSNVNFSPAVMPSLFNFNVPSNAQTVKNPLNIK
ncbi:MAG: outer membrane lipoprotein carrier protein LolA [Spirochaetes bacterium]|nr:outer membrane lipoprotein carrier protein LolA [Spirochaetota bacterium]